jgi:energy-converting hydrogenase B subunit Q
MQFWQVTQHQIRVPPTWNQLAVRIETETATETANESGQPVSASNLDLAGIDDLPFEPGLTEETRGSTPNVDPRNGALLIRVEDQPGVLYQLTRVIALRLANISLIDIVSRLRDSAWVYLELQDVANWDQLVKELEALPVVKSLEQPETLQKIYGKRVIIIGGGAQVGQVALGAISEADRHNIRGERISVDTIPLVGESDLAAAVRAVARLPRARALVMAGALMGGEISKAVTEVKEKGILVISLSMAGSVPDVADLVVSDPVQAGVMAVMAVADTAKFDINRQRSRRY